MVVVDTSVWIDYVRGISTAYTNALDYELSHNRVVTGDLLIAEFLQGFRNDKDFEAAKEIIDSLIYLDMLGKDIALKSALNFRFLRKNGITIRKTADIIIGTFCIEHELPLLHNCYTMIGILNQWKNIWVCVSTKQMRSLRINADPYSLLTSPCSLLTVIIWPEAQ